MVAGSTRGHSTTWYLWNCKVEAAATQLWGQCVCWGSMHKELGMLLALQMLPEYFRSSCRYEYMSLFTRMVCCVDVSTVPLSISGGSAISVVVAVHFILPHICCTIAVTVTV
jgi:hypothetical protein